MRVVMLLTLTLVCVMSAFSGQTQGNTRTVALLDITERNNEESQAEYIAAHHSLKVAGIPFISTTDIALALQYRIIILSSKLQPFTFRDSEKDSIYEFVEQGGILISPSMLDEEFHELFGITRARETDTHFKILFNTTSDAILFQSLDDDFEKTISLGSPQQLSTITSCYYTNSGGTVLGRYENNRIAVIRNNYGTGTAYALGFSFKPLILNNQLNRDYEANRVYDGFEPTSDAVMLFIRGIITKHIPNSVWLHTSPYNSKSSFLITHDIDASNAIDSMSYFADYESKAGISATYFITTKYFADRFAGYYNQNALSRIRYVLSKMNWQVIQ
jgi:hypothetical protein